MKISILGTKYDIRIIDKSEDTRLKESAKICDYTDKTIIIGKGYDTDLKKPLEALKKPLRHELVHAFLFKPGLASQYYWAESEEVIDWIALQMDKINQTYQEAINGLFINGSIPINLSS